MSDSANSTDPDQTFAPESNGRAATLSVAAVSDQLRPALLSALLLTMLTGVLFPLMLFGIARPMFPTQSKGGLLVRDGRVIGAELIGQSFTSPAYFHPRPSAAGAGYDAAASGGTNLGPSNPKLIDGATDDPKTTEADESFAGIRRLTEEYRKHNGLGPEIAVPIDAVTRSGSGLDPHISPANAALQVARIARSRGLSTDLVRSLVARHTRGRQFGTLGEPRVAVLPLNLELDRTAPPSNSASPPESR